MRSIDLDQKTRGLEHLRRINLLVSICATADETHERVNVFLT